MIRPVTASVAVLVLLAFAGANGRASSEAPDVKSKAAGLWADEGLTLRELAATTHGPSKADTLLRLGEWERQSALKVRESEEHGDLSDDDGQALVEKHLQAAEVALSGAIPIAADDRLPQVLFSLGDLRRFRGDGKGAHDPLARLIREFPGNALAVDASVALGDDAFDAGKLAEAMSRYTFASDMAPTPGSKAYARYKLAWCHLNLDEYPRARELFHEVIDLATQSGKVLSLADEARRDLVVALARDADIPAAAAQAEIHGLALPADRERRYAEGYAKLIAGAGRDAEADRVFASLAPGATGADAARLFTAQLEIATRRRDLKAAAEIAAQLANTIHVLHAASDDALGSAERALRVAAVTLHGEGRAANDARVLKAAMSLYDSYFVAFENASEAYELHHHAGELLLALKEPALAERHYTAAVERDLTLLGAGKPPGKWLDSSAQGAVTAAQEAMPAFKPPPREALPTDEDVQRAPPHPTHVSAPEAIFVAACERYLKALPHGSQATEVMYQRALVLYRHDDLAPAEAAFRRVAMEDPGSEPAQFAAQLAMDALRRLGKYDELAALTEEFATRGPLEQKLGSELGNVREAALLAAAAREAKQGNIATAAERYVQFAKTYPHSPRLDRALYNGAAAFAAQGLLDDAISLRARILSDLSGSPLAARARERQLSDLLSLGRFGDAAHLSAAMVDDDKGTGAEARLHDAVALAEAAGDVRGADALRAKYLKLHPRGPNAMAFALALADRARGCGAETALRAALAHAPDSAARAVVLSRLARVESRCHHQDEAHRHAVEAAATRVGKSRADALDASADGALLALAPAVSDYRKLPLQEPYQRTLPRKLAALKDLDAKLAKVIARGRAGAAVCALVESGLAYGDLAQGLSHARAPHGFNAEQRELFKEQLADKSQPLFDRAKTTLMEAITRAREAGVVPGCLNDARKTLASLWPERFGTRQEAIVALGPGIETASLSAAKILAKAPDAPAAWLMAGQAELAAGHPQAALVLAGRIVPHDPLEPWSLEVKARALDLLHQEDAALAVWLRLAHDYPDRPIARRVLADRALASRDLEAARDHLLSLSKTDANDVGVALNLGVVLRGLGDVKGAEQATRSAEKLAPSRLEASLNLGLLLCNEGGRPDEGIEALRTFRDKGGRPPDGHGFAAAMAACEALAKGRHP